MDETAETSINTGCINMDIIDIRIIFKAPISLRRNVFFILMPLGISIIKIMISGGRNIKTSIIKSDKR